MSASNTTQSSAVVNGTLPHDNGAYRLKDVPLGTPDHLRIRMIGAGASGLNMARHVELHMKNVDFMIYEKNDEVAGTWYENRYPGCACDIPAHSYQFAWAPNPNWSTYYPSGPEIFKYFQGVAKKFDLYRFIKLSHFVTSAIWDEEAGIWNIETQNVETKEVVKDWAHIFINGGGILNNWKWPDIEGLHTFKGELAHSAAWSENFDYNGKDVIVIGSGSSGIQIVPSLQPKVKSLTTFIRSPTWITPTFANKYANADGSNLIFTEEQRKRFNEDPEHYLQYRKGVEFELNEKFKGLVLGTKEQKIFREFSQQVMIDKLNGDERLIKAILPDFAAGCRRPTPGVGYLEALTKPNVNVVLSGIEKVVPEGIVTKDGQTIKADALICATGFDVSFAPRFKFIGRNGVDLKEQWKVRPRSYLSCAVENFPNYFMFHGPNAPIGQGSIITIIEQVSRYIINFMKKIQTQNIKSAAPKTEAVADLEEHIDESMKRLAFLAPCRSWFKNGKVDGPVIAIWPGSRVHFYHMTSEIRGEDWEFTYKTKNRFAYMGNNFSVREAPGQNISFYLEDPEAGYKEY